MRRSTALAIVRPFAALMFPLVACVDSSTRTVDFGSWGGAFQDSLVTVWVKPAADACGIRVRGRAWDGDYRALFEKIGRKQAEYDVYHVESYFVRADRNSELFERLPPSLLRGIDSVDALHSNEFAIPLLEYGYVLTYDRALLPPTVPAESLGWQSLFDTARIPGLRALRDTPIGNIEIGLLARGIAPDDLYRAGSKRQLDSLVGVALSSLDRIREHVVWWDSGDRLQQLLRDSEAVLTVAWSGRVASAMAMRGCTSRGECDIGVQDSVTLVSTDWLMIPRSTPDREASIQLLECMFAPERAVLAARFETAQRYSVPVRGATDATRDTTFDFILRTGESARHPNARINEKFWSLNYQSVMRRWDDWRQGR